ncbi:hypothetical protein [Lacisediminimonas sp.]|uniref:hypothetical protein n=1 Tax=Lacisediminimonas sp. TaxID=3060582 RepID=UPI0027231D78|nr:hypothetical protein [Lacisediminimonas sp.]MDO8300313.1 hypothetical protein [Lacisediminimonas sp.]
MKAKDTTTIPRSNPRSLTVSKKTDNQQTSPPPASFQEVNRLRRPKQTLASQIKNFFDPTRAQRKQQQWDLISKAEDKRVADWNKVRVSTPFNAFKNADKLTRSADVFAEYQKPRVDEIRGAIKKHSQSDFSKALFRNDRISPREWVTENKAALDGTGKSMKLVADHHLKGKDLAQLSDKQKLELAEGVWKTLFTDPVSTSKVPAATKALLGELVREVKNSPQFAKLTDTEKREVLRGVVNYGFNLKGVQSLLLENDRFTELRFQANGITERQESTLSPAELAEKRTLEAKHHLMLTVAAEYGSFVLGVKGGDKPTPAWLKLSDSTKSSGVAFFDKLVEESIVLADQPSQTTKRTGEDESSLVESSDESSLVESSDESIIVEVSDDTSESSKDSSESAAPSSKADTLRQNRLYEGKVRGGDNPLYIPKKD